MREQRKAASRRNLWGSHGFVLTVEHQRAGLSCSRMYIDRNGQSIPTSLSR